MLFRAEDTSRANYRSLFEYAVGDEARLAQDRRLAYYERVLPEMLARVKGLPLMYQTYSKQWTPESSRKQFVVKRLVPDFSKPIYEEDEEGNQVLKGYEKQDLVMESDQDIADFMARKGRFKGQHGFNKGFSYLAPIYHVQRDEMPFIQVDLDIDQADFGKQAWSRLLEAVEQVYNWFRENGYDALINFTGSSFHVWAKDGQVRTYAETKQVLEALSEATGLPLSAGAAHVAGQITIDYPQNKYRAPLRFPLSIHGDTGLVSIIIPRNQLRRFDPLKRAHPEEVLKRLPKELERIDAWFSDLSTTTTKQAEETFSAESRKMKELKNRIRIQLATLDEPLPDLDYNTDLAGRDNPRRLFYQSVRDSYGKTRYVPSIRQIGTATRQVEREMSAESQSSAADIIQSLLDELSDADKERCIWGDCGILADQLMKALQQAGHTDAVYEIGLAYIHPFEDYESKDFIGGHVVITVDGESYDAYGAGAKERWVEGPVIQDILAESGFVELGPLLSAHLTVNWITSTWDEIRESRSHLFSGQDVSAALDNWTLGKGAETEYKKKRQKPTPEPGVEGGTDLKPSRLKPPMKVKGSDVYSVQKHRADKRGSHRDIRIGLDGTLLSFVPVGRGFGKSRIPKKIGEGVSVIRTEDHPFDYWWFEGEIPKDSYGAGPVSLETYGTRRVIEWIPDEKLKVEFIGGKYAGTYTFERSKKSKDGKVWWMRKSRPVPEDKTDKKTKKAEEKWYGPPALEALMNDDVRDQYGYSMFSKALAEWSEKFLAGEGNAKDMIERAYYDDGAGPGDGFIVDYDSSDGTVDIELGDSSHYGLPASEAFERFARRYVEELLISAKYYRGRIKLYRGIQLVNPEDFDPTEVGQSWTPIKTAAKPYFGFQKYYSRNLERIYPRNADSKTYVLTALVPVESINWYYTLMRALSFGASDEKEIVLKRGAPIELIDVPFDLSFAIDGTPEALIRAAEEIERFVDEKGRTWELRRPGGWVWVESEQARETFINAFKEWSEKFLAGELPPVAGGWGFYHNRNQVGPTFILDFERMISDAEELDASLGATFTSLDEDELSTYVQNAIHYVKNLLNAQYVQGKLKLYRGIDLVNPEDFDPTGVGQSWTPVRAAAQSYFGHKKIRSRNLGIIYDNVDESEFKSYVLTALVPVDSIDWYTTVLRALAFSHLEQDGIPLFDEKEIVLKRGAPIELIDVPFDLSFAIDGTPEALIRAAEEDDGGKSEFERKYLAKVREYEQSEEWYDAVREMENMGDETFDYELQGRLESLFPDLELPLSQKDYEELILTNPELLDEERSIARSISDDMLDRVYAMLFARQGTYWNYMVSWSKEHEAEYRDGKILLYREITMNRPEELDTARAGIFWTPVLQSAEAHWGGTGERFLLRALVDFEDINWKSSWYANLIHPEECEIRLRQGAKIELLPLTRPQSRYGRNRQVGEYVYPEEIVFEIEAPSPNLLAVEQGTETELLEAIEDLPEEYRRLIGIYPVEPQPTRTGFASEQIFDYVPPQETVEWGFLQSYDRKSNPEGYVAQRYKNWSAPITGELLDSFLENSLYHGTTENAWELTQQKGYFTPREPFESQAKTGQSSLEGKNLIRQIGTYVTPVAGHAWQYAVGDWGPGSSKDRPSGGAPLVLKINPDLVRDLPWFIDLRDRAPSFFTTGRIPVEAVERVIEIPAEWPQRGFTTEPLSWYEHPLMPLLSEDLYDIKPSYLKGKALKAHQFWQEAIFEPGFLETRRKEYQKEWWTEAQRQIDEFYVSEMGLTPAEVRLIQIMGEDDESVTAFIRSENMGEPYDFNLWTRWWPKPRTSAETARPYKDYSLEDLLDVKGDWKNIRQELGIRMANLLQERQWASEDIDLTVGEAFDTALAEIRADVEAVQPRSKDLSEVTLEDYEKTKQVYQRFMIPAGITGDILRDEWWYESEPIYLWSDMFTLPAGAEEEWQQKIDAQKTETESDIFASNEINYAFYWFAVMQINNIYRILLERIGERKQFVFPNGYAGPPVELPDIIESQRDETEVKIYRWLATSQDEQPVRRLRNRMRPVDLNYYGGYGDVDRISTGTAGGTVVSVPKGLQALSYGPCWSLSPDAYTRTDQWRLAQEDVVFKEREVHYSKTSKILTEEEIDVRTYVIEKSIPASALDWYSTLISCALWYDSPEYEVIPKRGVFLSEEVDA
tara:strand:+ start:9254 stop:15781 length:6528 start_codon:yes stop_codon:yes gene_type:complete